MNQIRKFKRKIKQTKDENHIKACKNNIQLEWHIQIPTTELETSQKLDLKIQLSKEFIV